MTIGVKVKIDKIPPPPLLTFQDLNAIGIIVRDDVIRGVKAGLTPDGKQQRRNAKETLLRKSRKGIGRVLPLKDEFDRFLVKPTFKVRPAENRRSVKVVVTSRLQAKRILTFLVEGDQFSKGGGGYFNIMGISARAIERVQRFVDKRIKQINDENIENGRSKT